MSSRKVGPELKMLVARESADPDDRVDVLVRLVEEAGESTRDRLAEVGLTVRTVAGDVLTASCPVRSLDVVADLDEVVYLELSRPLHTEGGPEGSTPPTVP